MQENLTINAANLLHLHIPPLGKIVQKINWQDLMDKW